MGTIALAGMAPIRIGATAGLLTGKVAVLTTGLALKMGQAGSNIYSFSGKIVFNAGLEIRPGSRTFARGQ